MKGRQDATMDDNEKDKGEYVWFFATSHGCLFVCFSIESMIGVCEASLRVE